MATANVNTNPIEKAGEDVINNYCPGFKTSSSSYILPPSFTSEYPEERDPITSQIPPHSRGLTAAERNRYIGISSNQRGETGEYDVFCLFHALMCTVQSEQFLLLRTFDLDNNNNKSIKETELRNELPGIDLSLVNMVCELDFVVVVKDLGVIPIEVKSTATPNSIAKADKQLENGLLFFYSLMGGIRKTTLSFLPCVKVVIFANEQTPSPNSKTSGNAFQFHNDFMNNFAVAWQDILQALKALRAGSTFTGAEFETFTHIIVGLWCMTPVKPGFVFTTDQASTVAHTLDIDAKVAQHVISSDHTKITDEMKKSLPVTNVVYCAVNQLFRRCKDIRVIYWTPKQKDVYNNHPRVLLLGHAGSGKTFLSLFKMIDIVQCNVNEKVLLIAPSPHHLRCRNILKSNGVESEIVEQFPPKEGDRFVLFHGFQPPPPVCVITLDNFFDVSSNELLKYDVSKYNLFVDDLQSYYVLDTNNAKYSDISAFVDNTYQSALRNNKHFWCCMDVMQSYFLDVNDKYAISLLHVNKTTPRHLTIPTVELTTILRNTKEIIDVMSHARNERINLSVQKNRISSNMVGLEVNPGHTITSAPVIYNKLLQGTDDKHMEPFILQMVDDELELLFQQQPSFRHSDVAILQGDYDFSCNYCNYYKEDIERLLLHKYKCGVQSVQETLTNTNHNDVVYDGVGNTMSFEVPCVVYIRSFGHVEYNYLYVLTSRARCRLTIIDAHVDEPPFTTTNIVHLTQWKESNGTFEKL